MGAIAEMTKQGEVFNDGYDSIVIRRKGGCITAGRTLDMTGFDKVCAGHIIIREKETNTYKPLGVTNGAFDALPEGHEYKGILTNSVTKEQPFGNIMYDGEANDLCLPYPLSDSLRAALKTAFPSLYFDHD